EAMEQRGGRVEPRADQREGARRDAVVEHRRKGGKGVGDEGSGDGPVYREHPALDRLHGHVGEDDTYRGLRSGGGGVGDENVQFFIGGERDRVIVQPQLAHWRLDRGAHVDRVDVEGRVIADAGRVQLRAVQQIADAYDPDDLVDGRWHQEAGRARRDDWIAHGCQLCVCGRGGDRRTVEREMERHLLVLRGGLSQHLFQGHRLFQLGEQRLRFEKAVRSQNQLFQQGVQNHGWLARLFLLFWCVHSYPYRNGGYLTRKLPFCVSAQALYATMRAVLAAASPRGLVMLSCWTSAATLGWNFAE